MADILPVASNSISDSSLLSAPPAEHSALALDDVAVVLPAAAEGPLEAAADDSVTAEAPGVVPVARGLSRGASEPGPPSARITSGATGTAEIIPRMASTEDVCPEELADAVPDLGPVVRALSRGASEPGTPSSHSISPGPPIRERENSTSSTVSERDRRLAMERTSVPVKSRGKIVSLNEYTIVKKIGQGAFAEVKLAVLDDVRYAIKIIDVETIMKRRFGFGKPIDKKKTDEQMDDTTREIAIMKLMVHSNLIELYEVLRDEDNKHIYLVMEFMAGGPLMKYNPTTSRFRCTIPRTLLGNNQGMMNEHWCRRTFKALMGALGYLHCNFIVHRDLKPENILTDLEGNIKIGDFGVSRHFSEESAKETISLKRLAASQSRGRVMGTEGTWCFYSPEMCQEVPTPYSAYMADVWAASVCLYVFVFNVLPFFHAEVRTLFREIREKDPTERLPKNVSPELADLIKKLFVKDVAQRLSIDDIVKHPWMLIEDRREQMTAMDMFRESAEFTEESEDESEGGVHDKTMDTNFSDYFRTMCSELVSTSMMEVYDSEDEEVYEFDDGSSNRSRALLEGQNSSYYSMANSMLTDSSSSAERLDCREKEISPHTSKQRAVSSGNTPSMGMISELDMDGVSPALETERSAEEVGERNARSEPKSCCVVS